MPLKFEDLRVLEAAEAVADGIWHQVVQWDSFAREIVGGQIERLCLQPESPTSRQPTATANSA
jgi:hypothetical protein